MISPVGAEFRGDGSRIVEIAVKDRKSTIRQMRWAPRAADPGGREKWPIREMEAVNLGRAGMATDPGAERGREPPRVPPELVARVAAPRPSEGQHCRSGRHDVRILSQKERARAV